MPRFLTPSKVSLLGLALIYTEKEVTTSESVKVLGFLITHILPRSKHASQVDSFEHGVSLSGFETALTSLSSVMPGRTIYDLLVKKLWSIELLRCS